MHNSHQSFSFIQDLLPFSCNPFNAFVILVFQVEFIIISIQDICDSYFKTWIFQDSWACSFLLLFLKCKCCRFSSWKYFDFLCKGNLKVAMGNYLKSIQKIKGIMEMGIYKQARDEMNKFHFLSTSLRKWNKSWKPNLIEILWIKVMTQIQIKSSLSFLYSQGILFKIKN